MCPSRSRSSKWTCLLRTFWLLEKMEIPAWCKPFIVGLFGMLQDFSLDPYTVRQVFTVDGLTSGRWTWLAAPPGMVNIYNVPVYNFPGWMLIMLYASVFFLLGRAVVQAHPDISRWSATRTRSSPSCWPC